MSPDSIYESRDLLDQYLLFHYGRPDEILPYESGPFDALEFPVRCVTEGFDFSWAKSPTRALDLGCAVGRSSFELSRICDEVLAIDLSQSFINAADQLRLEHQLEYCRKDEGAIASRLFARPPAGCRPDRIRFRCADALAVDPNDGKFHFLLAANLLDRVPDPEKLLRTFVDRVVKGGQLVVTSPYTWLPEFTPRDKWLSSAGEAGNETASKAMERILKGDFRLAAVLDLPFLIREHARKYQWSMAQMTRWVRE